VDELKYKCHCAADGEHGDGGITIDYFSFIALCLVNNISVILTFNAELYNNLEVVYICRGRNLVPFS
jgi:hypothetical protein